MEINTERLILQHEFTPEDWPALVAHQANPRYVQYYDASEPTQARAKELLAWFVGYQQENPRTKFQMAVILRSKQGFASAS